MEQVNKDSQTMENEFKPSFFSDKRDVFIAIVMLASLFVVSGKVFFTPEPISTEYTVEELSIVERYQEEVLATEFASYSASDISVYAEKLSANYDPAVSCEEKQYIFNSIEDLITYQEYEFGKMTTLDGVGSCLTFSGFPKVFLEDAESTAKKMIRSVVEVHDGFAQGTGVVIGEDLVLTNYHVVSDWDGKVSTNVEIKTFDGKKVKATFVSGSFQSDVALIRTAEKIPNVVVAKLATSDPKIGEPILTIGHPSGSAPWTITGGVYYTSEPNLYNVESLLYSLPSIGGVSGSPIFNMDGEIVSLVYGARELSGSRNINSRYDAPLHISIISDYAVTKAISLETIREYLK